MKILENNSEKITITGYRNGFEEGFVQKKQNGKISSEKYKFVRNIEPLWFSENPVNIFRNIGIETTEQRARDFSNLFDGSLNGYYYLSMSKQDNSTSDENAKIILGYISERKASPQEAAKLINDRLEKIKNGK